MVLGKNTNNNVLIQSTSSKPILLGAAGRLHRDETAGAVTEASVLRGEDTAGMTTQERTQGERCSDWRTGDPEVRLKRQSMVGIGFSQRPVC